ncbi:ATP-binding protein [uncultured Cohaesibacter sp.]|uniref:ATP-binding protein n=1 Tax=uncultured Cohaesibacter sp. TaxID=1002546 RepID=UPI0029C8C66A|nr:ATP-binding protein [uncultured Cohaesibacter sp.]
MDLERLDFDLAPLVESVRGLMQTQARLKRLALKTRIAPGTPTQLQGDPTRLRQVLVNLVSNAIKFTDHGRVDLSVETALPGTADQAQGNDASGVTLLFTVRDTGIGISSAKVDHIFNAFSQADGSITRLYGGSGLGLAICKHIVSLMGGRIWTESVPGEGSTFFFTAHFALCVSMAPALGAQPQRQPDAAPGTPPMTQSLPHRPCASCWLRTPQANVRLAEIYLRKLGHSCVVANNGQAALQALAAERFDVVLMDLEMPEMDGLEATRRIRRGKVAKDVPIIAMTAHALVEFRSQSHDSGMNDYLTKPLALQALDEALRRNAPHGDNTPDMQA